MSVKGHLPKPGSQGKPGLYLNPSLVLFLAEGEAIINAPAADTGFGSQAPKAVIDIVAPQAPAGFGQMAQAFQQPAQQAPAAPAWNGQANHGVLPPTFQQPAQQAPAAPAPVFQQPVQFTQPAAPQFNPGIPATPGGFPTPWSK